MKLSKNFSYSEMIKSNWAIRRGVENTPNEEELVALTALCQQLQKIREHFGKVMTVTSGFRNKSVNEAAGSSDRSAHLKGEACDWEIIGLDNKEVAQKVPKILDSWDQLILEHYYGKPDDGWIHVAFNRMGDNRKQILKAVRKSGKTVYDPWDLT